MSSYLSRYSNSDDMTSPDVIDFYLLMSAEEKSVTPKDVTSSRLLYPDKYQDTIDLTYL